MAIMNFFRWNGLLGTDWFATDNTPRSNWDWLDNPGTNPGIPTGAGDSAVIDKGGDIEITTTNVAGAEELQIVNGSTVTFGQGHFGFGSDGSGGMIIDDAGELIIASGVSVTNQGSLDVIGLTTEGSLDVPSGAAFDDLGMIVGVDQGSTGEVTVDNAFFAVAQSGTGGPDDGLLVVGDEGDGSVNVTGANFFAPAFAIVGKQQGATGNINLNGAIWAGSSLTIGQSGSGHVTIGSGADLAVGNIIVGASQGAFGSLSINGASWTGDSLTVGLDGTGEVTIGQGASAFVASVLISATGSLDVTGASATLTAPSLTIDSTTMNVSAGGVVQSGTAVVDADQDATGSVTVTDATWSGTDLTIGQSGSGRVSIGPNATLAIDNVTLGADQDSSGDLTVDSSTWTGVSLTVGQLGTGNVAIENGSSAQVTSVLIGSNGSLGVTGAAGTSATLIASSLTIGFGTLDVSQGGEVRIGATLGSSGTVSIASGSALVGLGTVNGDVDLLNGGTVVAFQALPGALQINGNVDGAGTIEPLQTLEVNGVIQAGVDIAFNAQAGGGAGDLVLDVAGGDQGTITGFAMGNTIDVMGSVYSDALFTQGISGSTGTLTLSGGSSAPLSLSVFGDYMSNSFTVTPGATDTIVTLIPCFAAGTRIQTDAGAVPVEDLRVGDRMRCLMHDSAPVVWIGKRHIDLRHHPKPREVWPVRITHGAFADNVPCRDILLSPDHAVFVDGVLIPVRHLIDGSMIEQVPMAEVTYYHIELALHDVLLAEGLPAESYLDVGDRCYFSNGGSAIVLHPGFADRIREALSCAPIVVTGRELAAVRRRLHERARHACRITG